MEKFKYTNHLIEETSPYLYSHAHQPINWYPWGDDALKRSQNENKLLFISIGYSACHWCHNMAIECFENETVASILNEYYISIKIDKEERPDLDQIYLNAVQLMTDNAGWPLNCFALPDGTPVFGGTYFTSSQFIDIIQGLQYAYQHQYDKVKEVADDLLTALKNVDVIFGKEPVEKFTENDLKLVIEPWKRKFDNINGGTQNPPKFPLPNGKEFLMWAAYYFDDEEIKEHLIITLDKMLQGGIYDQIGGGFFRYTIDAEWKIPHFEKMLYDNVQLISLYCKGYSFIKNNRYKQVAEETIAFLLREMYMPEGAFYCSIDADGNGGEGKYYMWTTQELTTILQLDASFARDYYGILPIGNPEDFNILHLSMPEQELAEKYSMSIEEVEQKIREVKNKLFEVRNKRAHPFVDKKVIASWNGMAINALLNAYVAFGNKYYLDLALKTAKYIRDVLIYKEGYIYRCVSSKEPIKGFLDDYAFVIRSFIRIYSLTGDEQYINDAKRLVDSVISHFYDEQSGMLFFTSDEETVPIGRKMDFIDRAVPSAGSEMAQNLLLLSYIYNDDVYYNYARQMITNVKSQMPGAGPFISNWAKMLFYFIYEPVVVRLPGEINNAAQLIGEQFLPNVNIFPLVAGMKEGSVDIKCKEFYIDGNKDYVDSKTFHKIAIENKNKKIE